MDVTIGGLIKELESYDKERIVVLSMDPEGNNFRPLDEAMLIGAYKAGETGLESLTDEDRKDGYSQKDVMQNGRPAIIFYPSGEI